MQDEAGHVFVKNDDLARHCVDLLHDVLHTNAELETDSDTAVVAEAIRLMIDIIQLPTMADITFCEKNIGLVDRALECLYYLTDGTEGYQEFLQLLGVASIENLMQAALKWLESDCFSENQRTVAACEALLPL